MANPIQAMGRAIAKIDDFEVPAQPKTTFNVGRVGGGTSVNAIPFEAWMEVDMRSADAASLEGRRRPNSRPRCKQAVEEENKRWNNRGPVSVSAELVGVRPGRTDPQGRPHRADRAGRFPRHGFPEVLHEGSTDANVPMNLGIPAITIGGGGAGTGAHSLGETFNTRNSWQGTQRALLLAVALAR